MTRASGGKRSIRVAGAIGGAGGTTRQRHWTPTDGRPWRPPGWACCKMRPAKQMPSKGRQRRPRAVPTWLRIAFALATIFTAVVPGVAVYAILTLIIPGHQSDDAHGLT